MHHQRDGFITVIFSIILVTVLALLGTTVESARFNISKAVIERALFTSMDSILAEYNIPVFNKYHILMLDGGFETQTFQKQRVCGKAEEYMTAAFSPYKDLNGFSARDKSNLLGIGLDSVELSGQRYIYENKGMPFRDQAVKYEQYLKGTELVGAIKDKFLMVKQTPKNAKIISAKLEVEEAAADIDRCVLNLMKYIDGISTNSRGIVKMTGRRWKVENTFVKKIYSGAKSMSSYGIMDKAVFENVINHAVNAGEILNQMKEGDREIRQYTKQKKIKEDEICEIENNKKQKKKEKKLLKEIEELNKHLYKTYKKMGKDKRLLIKSGKEATEGIKKAMQEIKTIKGKREDLTGAFRKFEKEMIQNKKTSDPDLYHEIWSDYQKMKGVKTQIDLDKWNEILEENLSILANLSELEYLSISEEQEDLELNDQILDILIKEMNRYNTKDMVFYYGGLKTEEKTESPFECIIRLITNGLIPLVVDQPEMLSKKRMDTEYLISKQLGNKTIEDTSMEVVMGSHSKDFGDNITKVFKNLGKDFDMNDNIKFLADTVLFQEYLFDHFAYFEKEKSKDNMLDYEVEYCISGKTEERENIKSILNKLIIIRLAANLSYLITDKQKKAEAYATAISITGLTGIPSLIKLTQTMILILWSFEESLIDVRALFDGYEVPFLKTHATFLLKYEEIFTINKSVIKEKARQHLQDSPGNISYKDYLKLFLLIGDVEQLNYRSLDIVQENIRKKENADFLISNCLYAITIRGGYNIKLAFLNMPFIKNNYGVNRSTYSFELEREYSY